MQRTPRVLQQLLDTPTQFAWRPTKTWKNHGQFRKFKFAPTPAGDTWQAKTTLLPKAAKLFCVDNTNCRQMYLLRQVDEHSHRSQILPVVVRRVSILRFKSGQEAPARQKLTPGTVMYAAMLSRRQVQARRSSLMIQFDKNTGVLLNEKFVPVGTRVMYAAGRHINHKAFLKVAVMANYII
eukprot:PhM_4_TR18931/c0_g1_i1/m.12525/K02874/RP-L14, MRPL14, rplN; large subunit ribosomal protein L14